MPLLSHFRATPPRRPRGGFTLVELLVVITIILILVGLTVGVAGYAQTKARRSRAEAEIRALSTALESYKTDNGIYPRDAQSDPAKSVTDNLDARTQFDPIGKTTTDGKAYQAATKFLYAQLTGQDPANPSYPPKLATGAKIYFDFKVNMLGGKDSQGNFPSGVSAINDPFTTSYGYSTAYQADLEKDASKTPTRGFNPTYDLWSVAFVKPKQSEKAADVQPRWIINW